MIVDPPDSIQALLADFFPVHGSKLLVWHACCKINMSMMCIDTWTEHSCKVANLQGYCNIRQLTNALRSVQRVLNKLPDACVQALARLQHQHVRTQVQGEKTLRLMA